MHEILDVIHNTIYQFFDVCGDDEEVPISDKDKLLLEVNKAICNNLKALEQEPCEDAISRQAAKDWFCTNYCSEHNKCEHFEQGDCNAMIELFAISSVTPKQRTGHWIESRCDMYECSECDHTYTDFSGDRYGMNYCPNCGCAMVEPQESEDLRS